MPPLPTQQVPFLTRKMLNFDFASVFQLIVKSNSSVAGTIIISGATKSGVFTLKHITTADYTLQTQTFNLPDIPIWISVLDKFSNYTRRQLFIRVALAVNGDPLHQLVEGYAYFNHSLTWPNTSDQPPVYPEIGNIKAYTSSNPNAGFGATHTLGNGRLFKIKAINFSLVTDATVANRRVHIRFLPGSGGAMEFISSVDQIASTTRNYICQAMSAAGTYSDDNDILIPIQQDIILPAGGYIETVTTSLQAGDNFGSMTIWVEEFIA